MSIDSIQANQLNAELARRLAAKQNEISATEVTLNTQKQKTESKGRQQVQEAIDKNEQSLVQISKEGEQVAERLRNQHMAQSRDLTQKNQEHYLKLSEDAATQMKTLDQEVARQISNHQMGNLEKLAYVEKRSEDPFYRLKSFDANVSEEETAFKLNVKLPPHEAQNLFVTAAGRDLKLSLARSYEAKQALEDGRNNRTYSYQTVLEHITLPAKVDSAGMTREYADGVLTIRLKKNV